MAYAAVTSLMETIDLHFLQSQPGLPLEDLEAQIKDGNENLGLLQQILEKSEIANDDVAGAMKDGEDAEAGMDEKKKKKLIKSEKLQQLADLEAKMRDSNENFGLLQQILEAQMREMELDEEASSSKAAWDTILLTSRLREMAQVKQKIVSLHQNLGLLQESLEKSEIACHDTEMKDLEVQIRDELFKAEERIEMELTTIYQAKTQADSRLHITACLLRLHEIFNEAEQQTHYHRNELIRIQTEYQLIAKAPSSQNETITDVKGGLSQPDLPHKNPSKLDSGIMVGCHEVFKMILDKLTQQSTKGRQVVSIVGMGGIGKTTLAQKVYEYPSITSHFDMRAWVTVSQEYNVEQMLRCLVSSVIAASRDDLHKQSTDQLAERLRKHLMGERYLIVIDDIWSEEAWDSVQRCFPDDSNASRILLTSRLREVAKYASSGNSPINMPFLDAIESWNLYCNVFGKIEFDLVFEQIGRDIVKKCEGLPLAITVVASLLSKTKEVEEKWKNVAKSVMGDSNDACSRILYLSYNQLPHHLKSCFLYFGIFREDYEIPVKKLIRLWVAEGFLSTVKHVDIEKVAMKCLQDLVDRSLVIVSKQCYSGEMKRIRIHDLLRDLCLREARRENLLNVIGVKKPCRWISIHTSRRSLYNEFRFEDECFHKSHSLHFTHLYYYWYKDVKRLFSQLKLLRVVDMGGRFSDGNKALNVLANLVHLRYLAFSTYKTFEIKFFEHWNMQSFIVSGDGVTLDSYEAYRIWKMPLLRNFCIGVIFSLETPSVVHRNLENISWLDSKLCTKDLFIMIPNLKKLGVDGGYYDNNLDCFYNFVHLEQLEKLSIRRWMELNLVTCSIPWATTFLPNLKKLSFLESNLQWSDLSLISMLPNLEVLKLIHACKGIKWEPSDGGFCRLKRLVIENTLLMYWNAVGDHFPMLERLEISYCHWLEEIPRCFADITTLALIQLSYCSHSLLTSAKWIQDEQNNNYGNDALLVRSKNIMTKKLQ